MNIDRRDDTDLESLCGFSDNIDSSHGDLMGEDNKEDHTNHTSDGEYDYCIQVPLGYDFIKEEMTDDTDNQMGNDKESEADKGGDTENQMRDDEEVHGQQDIGGFSFYLKKWIAKDQFENRKLELYKAAIMGYWEKAEEIFSDSHNDISPTTRLNTLGETALHIATAANQIGFVDNLVNLMEEEDLKIKTYGRRKSEEITPTTRINELADINVEIETTAHQYRSVQQEREDGIYHSEGNTALCYAAVSGNIITASCMLEKVPDLVIIRGEEDILPIQMAAWHGHHKMVDYLYEKYLNHCKLDENDDIDVLMAFIDCDMYDIAMTMVSEKPWLAAKANSKGLTALYAFAQKSRITSNNFHNNTSFLKKYFSKSQGLCLVKLLLELAMPVIEERHSILIKKALFKAAEKGNYEFLTTALDLNRNLAFELDENYYTIFHIALLYRHVDIFKLVDKMDSIQNVIRLTKDKEGNNILHLAAKLPLSGLKVLPGEALQLQRELHWFQKVKKLFGKHLIEAKNDKKKTPQELFAEEHEVLRKGGEKWMKDTINSCMVVATLVAGVAFASAVTVPGGTGDGTGIPLLLNHICFKIFAISNALSLIFSASSILLFLRIFTSHYSLGNFLKSLPTKFTLGLLSLSAAVHAMVVAFFAAFFIMFKQQNIGFAYPIAAMASIPMVFFIIQHFRLLVLYIFLLFSF